MEIRIYTGQEKVDERYIEEKLRQDIGNNDIAPSIFFEKELIRPYDQFYTYYEELDYYFDHNESIYIATFSEHILNAVRLIVKNNSFTNAKVCYIKNNRECMWIDILSNGRLTAWPEGMFDMYEKALMKLL